VAQPQLDRQALFNLLLKQEPKIKSAYHVAFDLQFDRNNAAWAQQSLTGLGVEWKGDAFYQAGAVDFASIVAPAIQAIPM
jgi:hypothetical protein